MKIRPPAFGPVGTLRVAILLGVATVLGGFAPAEARLQRRGPERPFLERAAFSGYYGLGVPTGEFKSDRPGDGNHADHAPNLALQAEYYFAPKASIGAFLSNTTYEDRTDPELETHLSNFGGFLRLVLREGGSLHPFLMGGVGGQKVQFQDPTFRVQSDTAWMVEGGGGVMLRLGRYLALCAEAMYHHGFTENTVVPGAQTDPNEIIVVGFDTKYATASAGVTFFFP